MRKKLLSDLKKIVENCAISKRVGKNATKIGTETNRNGKTGSKQRK